MSTFFIPHHFLVALYFQGNFFTYAHGNFALVQAKAFGVGLRGGQAEQYQEKQRQAKHFSFVTLHRIPPFLKIKYKIRTQSAKMVAEQI